MIRSIHLASFREPLARRTSNNHVNLGSSEKLVQMLWSISSQVSDKRIWNMRMIQLKGGNCRLIEINGSKPLQARPFKPQREATAP